jgi:hypothetical protein
MSTLELKELSHPSGEVIKIAAGKTLDLHSQGTLVLPTIPYAKMPTGSVLQVVSSGTGSLTAFSGTSGLVIGATITPKQTSGTFLITVVMSSITIDSHSGYSQFQLKQNGTTIESFGYPFGWSSSDNDRGDRTLNKTISFSTSGGSFTFDTHYIGNGSQAVQVNRDGHGWSSVTIMEIAQ